MQTARDEILTCLKAAPRIAAPARPQIPPLKELAWDRKELIDRFTAAVTEQTGVVHRAKDTPEVMAKLAAIAADQALTTVMVSTDEIIVSLDLRKWGKDNHIEVLCADVDTDRKAFKDAAFQRAQAGITGVDFAVAESGTLVLCHDKSQPRLISLAPIFHIALVPLERLVAVYENATDSLFGSDAQPPRHITFITGPSMTADIQGIPFRGMHGPRRLEVILIG